MKDEYVKKEDAINALEEKEHEPWYLHKDLEWISGVVEAKDEIKSLEPADVAPVVRCKDCRKCIYDSLFDQLWCNMTPGTRRVKPDDFCSYGKRREE